MSNLKKNWNPFPVQLIFVCLVIFNCKDNPTQNKEKVIPSNFLPQSEEINGWTRSYDVGDWIETETTDGLYEMFNGEPTQKKLSETFMAYHFTRGVKQVYGGRINEGVEELEVRIFDLKFPNQAQGLFYDDFIEPASFDFLDQIGFEGRINISSSENIVTIDFYYDKWYAWISISGRWSVYEAKNVALLFANMIFDNMLLLYPVES